MGEVFHARTTGVAGFEKQVVIKRILPHLALDPLFVERFVEEGKLVVQLEHASIAQVYDLGEEEGVPYLAMEYVDGRDLRELMKLSRAADVLPSIEIRAQILVGILEALDYAHRVTDAHGVSLGIIHRDVSPANVMVSRTGEVKLVDFGIARVADRGNLSVPGSLQGKYAYMSPEQAAGLEMDGRSDLFSAGVLAWELYVGERPFDGESDLQTLDRIRHFAPGSLADAFASGDPAPPEIVDVVDRLLSKSPDERPATAAEAIRTLRGLFLRRGLLVSSRDVGDWVASVLAAVPEDLRDPSASGLSLEDALLLPMGSPGEKRTATVSSGDPAGGALVLPEISTAASTRPGGGPSAEELADLPPTIGPRRRRGRLMGLLVSLNLLLLASVAILVWQQSQGPEERTETPSSEQRPPAPASPSPPVLPAPANPAATVVERPPAKAPAQPKRVTNPVVKLPARAPLARQRHAPVGRQPPPVEDQKGRVEFRFYPASSKVLIDGVALPTTSSNVVSHPLAAGRHRLTLLGPDGVRRVETFTVKSGKTTNLTTLHVTAR